MLLIKKDRRDILDGKSTIAKKKKKSALTQVYITGKEKESLIIYGWECSLESNQRSI